MNILIDICHPAHVNFFKTAVYQLEEKGHHILITVLNRGKLPVIAKDVFKEYEIKIINRHRGKKLSILFEANIFKFFTLFWICLKFRPDIGLSAGSFVLGAVLKIFGKPNIQFDDDPERKMNVLLEKITSTFLFFPVFYNETSKKTGKYYALKEWSYLSPHYINPDPEIVSNYGIKIKEYIFVREVSVSTLNYTDQPGNIIASVAKLFPHEMKVLLSLENKSTASQYPDHWIILKEPVNDIHSLIYFSKIVISSGDSMAREGAMLGVPSIYCGIREMAANKVMIDKKMLLHLQIQDVPGTINGIINGKISFHDQDPFRSDLMDEWDDVPGFILEKIYSLL
jgi:uncharacterized protein